MPTVNSLTDARKLASQELSDDLAIVDEQTDEYEFGWIFYYDSRRHLKTRSPLDSIGGNAPLLVERETGRVLQLGTAAPVVEYVRRYVATGDPHGEADIAVVLSSTGEGDRMAAVRALRRFASTTPSEAIASVNAALEARASRVNVSAENVDELIGALTAAGLSAECADAARHTPLR